MISDTDFKSLFLVDRFKICLCNGKCWYHNIQPYWGIRTINIWLLPKLLKPTEISTTVFNLRMPWGKALNIESDTQSTTYVFTGEQMNVTSVLPLLLSLQQSLLTTLEDIINNIARFTLWDYFALTLLAGRGPLSQDEDVSNRRMFGYHQFNILQNFPF